MISIEKLNSIVSAATKTEYQLREILHSANYIEYEIYRSNKFFSTIFISNDFHKFGESFLAGYIIGRI
jgi:hypothetical protein